MSQSRFIKDKYDFITVGERVMVEINDDDGKYAHNITLFFKKGDNLEFMCANEQNNKTTLVYLAEDKKIEKMHKGLIEDIRRKYND